MSGSVFGKDFPLLQTIEKSGQSLRAMVERAAQQLAGATTAAEILDAHDMADVAYTAAKTAGRLARAKGAHDELVAKAHRAQADALEIESLAKRRLADEYDAGQDRGEVASGRPKKSLPDENTFQATTEDLGISSKEIFEARQVRDAEKADPGIVRRVLDEKLAAGEEPTKAALREAVVEAAKQGLRGAAGTSRKNPTYVQPSDADIAWTHVYGVCRALTEWATDENLALMRAGLSARNDDQSSNINAVKRAAEILSSVVESINAA
jgi:hypothetical protein